MAKKLLAMVLGLTMMIGVAGCSAVDTGSGSNDKNADTQVSVSAELLDLQSINQIRNRRIGQLQLSLKMVRRTGLRECRLEWMNLARKRQLM